MCTRVVYKGPSNTIITARSMDFRMEIPANIWILPAGMKRVSSVGTNVMEWTSKYGSVVTSSWDIAVSDGMNEKGLVANLLWLTSTNYPTYDRAAPSKALVVSFWAQYVLDHFATVLEAVTTLQQESFVIVSDNIPGTDRFVDVHLSISDSSGDSAIFEYINGKLTIHHDASYVVMTNDPIYDEQLAINAYWRDVPGTIFLPGTNRAQDRFVRASYYINAIPQTNDKRIAIASVFSVIRNVSVPYGISIEGSPNLSTTRWRTVSDQKNLTYYFEDALSPNTIWVDFDKIDLTTSGKVKKLALSHEEIYAGETSGQFIETEPLQFLCIK